MNEFYLYIGCIILKLSYKKRGVLWKVKKQELLNSLTQVKDLALLIGKMMKVIFLFTIVKSKKKDLSL
jgi:hypothetical protein